jgi:hypothetical protein
MGGRVIKLVLISTGMCSKIYAVAAVTVHPPLAVGTY